MANRTSVILGALVISVHSLSVSAEPASLNMNDFAFGAELAPAGTALRRFPVTPVIIRDIQRRDLGDIRVYDGNNALMPTLVRNMDGQVTVSQQRLSTTPVRVAGKTTGYILDRSSKHAASVQSLLLRWKRNKAPNLLTIRVEHSADKKAWRTLVESATVSNFNFEGIWLIQNHIDINNYTERYIRLTFLDRNPSLSLASVTAYNTNRKISDYWWIHAGKLQAQDSPPNSFGFSIRPGIDPEMLKLIFPDINSIISGSLYTLESLNGELRRKLVTGNFVSCSVTLNNKVVNSRPVDISQWHSPDWLIVADAVKKIHADNLPGVLLAYPRYEVVFAAAGDEPYTAVWGNAAAGQPVSGDIAGRIESGEKIRENIAELRLVSILDNTKLTELMRSRQTSWLEVVLWLFAAVIAAAAVGFGYRRTVSA